MRSSLPAATGPYPGVYKRATAANVPGRSTMNHDQLADALAAPRGRGAAA
ncbi:hypothetical protein ACWFQ8_12775 [Streptomyces sp. NPDC055254]